MAERGAPLRVKELVQRLEHGDVGVVAVEATAVSVHSPLTV